MPAPRKAEVLHELHGTRIHDRAETTPGLNPGRPRYPKDATPEDKRIFKKLCKQLSARRALTEGDEFLLTLASSLWVRRGRAHAKLLEEGEVTFYTRLDPNGVAHKIEKPNLHLKVAENCEKQLVAILDRLGLTPLNATKVKLTKQEKDARELTHAEKYLLDIDRRAGVVSMPGKPVTAN